MLWVDEKMTCLLVAIKPTVVRFAKIRRHCFSAANSEITSTANIGAEAAVRRCSSK